MSLVKLATCLWAISMFGTQLVASARFGLLHVIPEPGQEQVFCLKVYSELYNVSAVLSDAPTYPLADLEDVTSIETCESSSELEILKDKVSFVSAMETDGNCSIADRAQVVQEFGALGLIADTTVKTKFNSSEFSSEIFVAALYAESSRDKLLKLKESHPEGSFQVYSPEEMEREIDGSLLLIFCMATFTVAMGSLWSGYTKHMLRTQRMEGLHRCHNTTQRSSGGSQSQSSNLPLPQAAHASIEHEDVSVRITPVWVLMFVCMMCTMLVLLYFFLNKLVYVIIGMFCIASVIATYACFEPIVMWSYQSLPWCPTLKLPRCNMLLCVINMELRQFLLLLIAISLSVLWVIYRNNFWCWILQDFLGIIFCTHMLKVLRLPSFKICTFLLGILFFYDIFFVFITPLITKDGKSVMVEVATGGDTGEQLPMVLKVPHMNKDPLYACWVPFSLLGFGDILVPGLLMSYCCAFDYKKELRFKPYWSISIICYACSLVATFVSLLLMDSAQPALLYIVPGTVIPMALVACIRGEFKEFWDGDSFDEHSASPFNPAASGSTSDGHRGHGARKSQPKRTDEEAGQDDEDDMESRADGDEFPVNANSHSTSDSGNGNAGNDEPPDAIVSSSPDLSDQDSAAKNTKSKGGKKKGDSQRLLE